MNKITPEHALAEIRAVRRDRADSHWFACACALADAHAFLQSRRAEQSVQIEALQDQNRKLRAELDALNAVPAAPEPPALARFLPVHPDDVPAPPEGWVYVGRGHISNVGLGPSCNLMIWNFAGSSEWSDLTSGHDQGRHYAIRWTAPADIWHRFGVLAPSEGGGWIPHCPDDPMPCEGLCKVLLKGEIDDAQFRNNPGEVRFGNDWYWKDWYWDADDDDDNVIGWRPMIAEVAT
jgi:hypothetical protein